MIFRKGLASVCLVVTVASCSSKTAGVTTTVATTTSTSTTTSTTTTTTSTTVPIAPPATEPEATIPTVPPAPRMASGPCEMPDHLDYCVWGTYGLDNTVSNSRSVPIETGIQQIFTPVTGDMTTVQLEFQSTSIGKLIEATEATDPQAICVQMSIASTDGIPLSTMAYTVKSTTGIRQRVKVPLQNAMIKGVRNALTLQKGPACLSKDLTTMVAMSSKYKYPAKYGSLKINGQKSTGSLWAVID